MLVNSWKNVTLICGNHGNDHTHDMQLKEGPHSLFYACPEYKSIFGTDHSGKSCNNRLTLVDFEKMLGFLEEKGLGDGFCETDLTGFHWKKNGVEYTVLEHKNGHFTVKMLNRKAINK
uniref:hypothetical protein n=1 Tax=Lachnoclostridium phocaeense TaxID=1871021 RepID=UPI0026DC1CA7|nr:hypothetical protein [Lachnoclostridium phocaeense]